MIIRSISQLRTPPLFYELKDFIPGSSVYIKLEGLNIAGSIKLTTAMGLLEGLEKAGKIKPDTILIESSSGNLGVALSMLCKEKGYPFFCVTDPNILPENEKLISIYGAKLIKITERDQNGGYLGSRIQFIQTFLHEHPQAIWLNQYANEENPNAHYRMTGEEILAEFPKVDFLFIGAGTTGTLMGCARLFREKSSQTKIIAVDSVGSVTFGFPSKKRHVPGLGTSRKPEIANPMLVDSILQVEELNGIHMCHSVLEKYQLLLGGSSGSTLAGIQMHSPYIPLGSTIVTISPDFGHKYLDNVYEKNWIHERFGYTH